jgi:thiosulfate dehydrogenase
MPYGTTYLSPQLTDEEAWDIAAYVNSMDRPNKPYVHDWPDISKKPIDLPFGPYADTFSVQQHKYGPFAAIQSFYKKPK